MTPVVIPPRSPRVFAPPPGHALTLWAVDCLYRGCVSGCARTRCHANYGDRDKGRRTTLSHCETCVGSMLPGKG